MENWVYVANTLMDGCEVMIVPTPTYKQHNKKILKYATTIAYFLIRLYVCV